MNSLFLNKELKNDTGGFGSLILLHGIYQEVSKVREYHARALSSWVPSLQRISQSPSDSRDLDIQNAANISNWRNAALDCVDVLHWAANSTIAKAAGVEHPTVLHLHFARVVLLAPYHSIHTLARSIINLKPDSISANRFISKDEASAAEQDVLRWAQQDEHKARLAALHCGCFYWHVRRYSQRAFYEPLSVYLVTLTLWAYSSYTSRANTSSKRNRDRGIRASPRRSPRHYREQRGILNASETDEEEEDDDDDREPKFIRLDRPNDDEMVQLFVRKGRPSAMTAHIAGVGNICSPQGPTKILREGIKILKAVTYSWGRSREQISVLEALEKAVKRK